MWYAQVSVYDNCASALGETLMQIKVQSHFKVILYFLGYMLVRIDKTFTESLHVSKQKI